ncbi:TPM domain-containing protein [Qipengyuania sp. GH38]|uniref:TPM domain-containing protein n=1 Tax=Qipengyuania intermedia TaxID=2867244 RepID=UPI001C872AAF|nr:TPM domain-containing protein [Qipengyuania intermedia]MBX7514742.1 TPM domain-containing protein [Qipengyuania intermedia]
MRHLLAVLALAGALLASPALAQEFPELTGRVVDQADLLSPAEEAELTQKLAALEDQSQRQLVVATIRDLQGYDIADYSYQLGREWALGDADRDDGALLVVAPNERRVHIATGYGVEGYLTDALSAVIIQNDILPRFKEGDYPAGINAGADAIIGQLVLPEDEARRIAAEASQTRKADSGFPYGGLIWLGFIFFFFILPMLTGRGRRRRYKRGPWGNTARDIILWEVGSAIARGALSGGDDWGGGSGGGFGGGFGGGGFSGGGGSFGGGGASGGW